MGVSGRPKRMTRVPARLSDAENVSSMGISPSTTKNKNNQQSNGGLKSTTSTTGVLKSSNSLSSNSPFMENLKGKNNFVLENKFAISSLSQSKKLIKSAAKHKFTQVVSHTEEEFPAVLQIGVTLPEKSHVNKAESSSMKKQLSKKRKIEEAEIKPESSPVKEVELTLKKKIQAPKREEKNGAKKIEEETNSVEPSRKTRALSKQKQTKVSEEANDNKLPIARGTRSSSKRISQIFKETPELPVLEKKQSSRNTVLKGARKAVANKKFLSTDSEIIEEMFSDTSPEEAVSNKTSHRMLGVLEKKAHKSVDSVKKRKVAASKYDTKDLDRSPNKVPLRLSKKLDIDQVLSQLDSDDDGKVAVPSFPRRSSRRMAQHPSTISLKATEASQNSFLSHHSSYSPVGKLSAKINPSTILKQSKLMKYSNKTNVKKSPSKKDFQEESKLPSGEKRVPIWKKVEPKPEPVSSKVDDIYELEFSDSEAKPAKKKRKRAVPRKPKMIPLPKVEQPALPRSKDTLVLNKPKELTLPVVPEDNRLAKAQDMLPQPTTPHILENEGLSCKRNIETKNPGRVTPLLKNVAKKLERFSTNQDEVRICFIPNPVENEIFSPPKLGVDTEKSVFFDGEGLPELPSSLDHSTNPVIRLSGPPMDTSSLSCSVPLDLDNCFGFEETEHDLPPVESTPMKNQATTSIFVSPILKNSHIKPARLDQDEIRKLIRLAPSVTNLPTKKQTTLTDFITRETTNKVVEGEQGSGNKNKRNVPLTPPSAFAEPPRRSYSKRSLVVAKRAMFLDDSEQSGNEDDAKEAGGPNKRKKTVAGKKATANSKRDAEIAEWEKLMASHFEDVENFDLSQ